MSHSLLAGWRCSNRVERSKRVRRECRSIMRKLSKIWCRMSRRMIWIHRTAKKTATRSQSAGQCRKPPRCSRTRSIEQPVRRSNPPINKKTQPKRKTAMAVATSMEPNCKVQTRKNEIRRAKSASRGARVAWPRTLCKGRRNQRGCNRRRIRCRRGRRATTVAKSLT